MVAADIGALEFSYGMKMRIRQIIFVLLCMAQCLVGNVDVDVDVDLLHRTVSALDESLRYMEDHVSEINLDGVFGCRLAEEHLKIFIASNTVVFHVLGDDTRNILVKLQKKARDIVQKSTPYLKCNNAKYFKVLGGMIRPSEVITWHPSKRTIPSLREDPLPCRVSVFNGSFSDSCLHEVIESKNIKNGRCNISDSCFKYLVRQKQREFILTHQVLYLQTLQKNKCLKYYLDSQKMESLQDYLCTNVMRDAERIAENKFPRSHQDLFMEQVGLCGIWGYSDFYKHEWLEAILEWQRPEGCFDQIRGWYCTDDLKPDKRHRVKRNDVKLPDGCSSHKTSVAIVALAANIRFSAENIASNYLPDLNG